MQPCAEPCQLPERFDSLALDQQARLILQCRIKDVSEFRLCGARQRALAEWIERGDDDGED